MGGFSIGDRFSLGVEADFGSDKNFQAGDIRWHNQTASFVMLIERRSSPRGNPAWLVENVLAGGQAVTEERRIGRVVYTEMEILAWASRFA